MNEQNEKSSADSRLKYSVIYTPFPLKNLVSDTGSDDTQDSRLYNPLTAISDNDDHVKRMTFNLAGSFGWEIIKNLKFKSDFGYDDYRNNESRYYGTTTYYSQNLSNTSTTTVAGLPAIILTNTARNTIRNTNTLNYDFKSVLNPDHHLTTMIGQEYIMTHNNVLTMNIQGFPEFYTSDQAFKLTTQGLYDASTDNYYSPDDILLSYFGRLNYDYQGKYLLSGTFRADGSSKFSEKNRWGYFPSAALAWRVSSEPFMEKTKDWLDDMKLRLSYGTAGNNNIPSGQMTQSYGSSSTSWINGVTTIWVPSKIMANPDLKWETTITRNLGLDYSLFNGKLSGSVESYLNTTTDLLINFPVTGTGYDTQYRNMGETQNKGLELSVNVVAVDKKHFGLSFSGNIGFNKNKITSLGVMSDFGAASGWASTDVNEDYWISKGGSVGHMYGYVSDGRYEVSDFDHYDATTKKWVLKTGVADASQVIGTLRPGSMKLKDVSGDGTVTTADRTIIGNANPIHTGGFNINSRVYNFDISANFNWSYGNDIYNANKIEYTTAKSGYMYRNMTSEMASGYRWTNLKSDGTISNDATELAAMNGSTTMWSPYMSKYVFSDWAVEDGSFLRLSTLTIGYTLPSTTSKMLKIEKFRMYVTAYNVFCLTNYSGYDPEVSTRRQTNLTPGVDYSAYPKSRQLVVGLNLNF